MSRSAWDEYCRRLAREVEIDTMLERSLPRHNPLAGQYPLASYGRYAPADTVDDGEPEGLPDHDTSSGPRLPDRG